MSTISNSLGATLHATKWSTYFYPFVSADKSTFRTTNRTTIQATINATKWTTYIRSDDATIVSALRTTNWSTHGKAYMSTHYATKRPAIPTAYSYSFITTYL